MFIRSILASLALGTLVLACASDPEDTGNTSANQTGKPTQTSDSTEPGGKDTSALKACCGGRGKCVPTKFVNASQLENLEKCEGSENVCAPNEFIDKADYGGKACKSSLKLGGSTKVEYDGVCLSDCLKFPSEDLLGSDGCNAEAEKCVPCKHPVTGEATGAPGCK